MQVGRIKIQQKSLALIFPYLGVKDSWVLEELESSYMGYNSDEWGEYFYLLFPKPLNADQLVTIEGNKYWKQTINFKGLDRLFEFRFDDVFKETVVKPFLSGKYSEISKTYKEENFAKIFWSKGVPKLSWNWQILNKEDSLREWWRNECGIDIPEDQEVWARPSKDKEILK